MPLNELLVLEWIKWVLNWMPDDAFYYQTIGAQWIFYSECLFLLTLGINPNREAQL